MFYLCGKLVIWAPNCQGLQRKVFEIRTCCYKSECSHSSRINRPLENSSSENCHRPVMLCTPANMTSLGGQVPWLFDCAPCQVEHVPWKHLLRRGSRLGNLSLPQKGIAPSLTAPPYLVGHRSPPDSEGSHFRSEQGSGTPQQRLSPKLLPPTVASWFFISLFHCTGCPWRRKGTKPLRFESTLASTAPITFNNRMQRPSGCVWLALFTHLRGSWLGCCVRW